VVPLAKPLGYWSGTWHHWATSDFLSSSARVSRVPEIWCHPSLEHCITDF